MPRNNSRRCKRRVLCLENARSTTTSRKQLICISRIILVQQRSSKGTLFLGGTKKMISRNEQMPTGLRWLRALLGVSVLAITACAQMIQPAHAAAATKAYVANFKDNTVSVIETDAAKVIATIQVAAGPHGMAITQGGRTVYVSGDGSSSVDVIDTATDKVVKTITVGKTPNGIALTPDDRLLLVAVYAENRIDFIDTSTQAVVATSAVPKPHTIAISPDGKF